MAFVKKPKQVTVEVSDLTIELNEKLTAQLESASTSEKVSPEDYVLAILTKHFSSKETIGTGTQATDSLTGNTDKKKSGSSKDKSLSLFEQLKREGDNGKRVATELIAFMESNEGMDNTERERLKNRFQAVIDSKVLRGAVPEVPDAIKKKAHELLNVPSGDDDKDSGLFDESDLSTESLRNK